MLVVLYDLMVIAKI